MAAKGHLIDSFRDLVPASFFLTSSVGCDFALERLLLSGVAVQTNKREEAVGLAIFTGIIQQVLKHDIGEFISSSMPKGDLQ